MKKNFFITFFIAIHILLIFLQIHKHTLFIKNNYKQQLCEKEIIALTEKKQMVTQQLYALKDRNSIKKFAYEKLKMRPYTLHQVKKITPP